MSESEHSEGNNIDVAKESLSESAKDAAIIVAGESKDKEQSNIAASTKKSSSRKTKKRSRKDMDTVTQAERQMSLKQDRYDKLLYLAKKLLTKQAKQVRAFMVQRSIRKLKAQNDDKEEKLLQPLKDLSLDLVVQQAIRQLGLIHANPNPLTVEPPVILPPEQAQLVSSVLDHKRFQSALEEWNEKVADFRRFCLLLDDSNHKFSKETLPRGKKSKTTTLRPQDQPSSFFCTSLNDQEEEEENDMMAYGPAAAAMEEPKPKNRQGQRARKAKALALQAKKEGRQYESLNWREEKEKTTKADDNKKNERQPIKKSTLAGSTKKDGPKGERKPEEDLSSHHPSWAAKQQQKSGIVAFQGKKITFD